MGLTNSQCISNKYNDCSVTCTCFNADRNIQHVAVIQNSTDIWNWTDSHDATLNECLSAYGVPSDITNLIQHHAFNSASHWYITKQSICRAKHYAQIGRLLSKPMCTDWFEHYMHVEQSIHISLMNTTNTSCATQLYDSFIKCTLPALCHHADAKTRARRTMYIDGCQVPVAVCQGNWQCQIYVIVVSVNESIWTVHRTMQAIHNLNPTDDKCYILTRTGNGRIFTKIEEQRLRRMFMNISPCFKTNLSSQKSIMNLFKFAIKYYWFCSTK
eukprot:46969_1